MAVVETAILLVLLAGCTTTLIVLFTSCNGIKEKSLEMKEEDAVEFVKDV